MGQTKIRMKTLQAGPDGAIQPGTELLIEAKAAQTLVDAGHAEFVAAAAPEATMRQQPERAIRPPATPRAAGLALSDVPGIGPSRVAALAEMGIADIPALLSRSPAEIAAAISGVAERTATEWQDAARALLV